MFKVLDLFCKAGGAAQGLKDAWADAEIIGVDIEPQKNYPFEFLQYDVMRLPIQFLMMADFIWASPPCQHYSKRNNHVKGLKQKYPDLVKRVRTMIEATGAPFVIENVPLSPLLTQIELCGSMFGLDIYRHRLFESNRLLLSPSCSHSIWNKNRFEGGRSYERGHSKALCRSTVEIGRWGIPLSIQKEAMGIDWMSLEELSEAIPPAYIARQIRPLPASSRGDRARA